MIAGKNQLQIKVLGTPEIIWLGQPYKLSRRQARGLLYYLGNELQPVSRDRLCFLFWPDTPQGEAQRKLTRLLSLLRKELPDPELLLIRKEAVSLDPDRVWSDAADFTRLQAEPTSRAKQTAVDLYRGTFLDGFSLPFSPEFDFWLSEEGSRYQGLYLSTLSSLIESRTQAHDLDAAIRYAQMYLAVDELAEDVHRRLITLYAATGDPLAATRQFESCTLILERELGVEPLPETRLAYDAARSGELVPQSVVRTQPTWTVLPSLDLPLIGREEPWEALEKAYQGLHAGGVILISGEPGVGKTRLMQEFATSGNRTVLTGSSHRSTQTLPYQPLIEALRQAIPHPQLWNDVPPIWLGEISYLLPELRGPFPDLPQPIAVEPDQAQARLFEALTQIFLGLAARAAPLFFCLDDLQWADEATLGWLSAVARRLANKQMYFLGTYRQGEQERSVQEIKQAFRREGLLKEVKLSGLSQQAIVGVLAQVHRDGAALMPLATRLYETTGGNPFFVLEIVRALLESGELNAPPETLPLPETVQETIQARLVRLTPLARQILDAAAVLSPDLQPGVLAKSAGRTGLETADGLDELVRRQLLQEGAKELAFRHDLLRTAVYQALSPWRQQLLHRRTGDALREVYARTPEIVAAQMAQHYDLAGAYEQAVEFYELAARTAQTVYAHKEAIRHFQRAIALAAESKREANAVASLHEALGDSFAFIGRYPEAFEAYQSAIGRIPGSEPIKRASLSRKQANTLIPQQKFSEAINLYWKTIENMRACQDLDSNFWLQVWFDTHLNLLNALYFQGLPEEMSQVSSEIQGMLDQFGSPSQRFQFLRILDRMQMRRSRFRPTATNLEHRRAILDHQMKTENPAKMADAHFGYAFMLLWYGDFSKARHHFGEALALAEKYAYGLLQVQCLTYLMVLYRLQGQTSQVQEMWPFANKTAKEVGFPMYIAASLANRAWLHYRKNQWEAAKVDAHTSLEDWGSSPYPFKWLAHWILLAVALHENKMEAAMQATEGMLNPVQQHLPDEVMSTLERASECWRAQDGGKARTLLEQAVKLAKERGFL